jgi:hypothetical protein
MELEDLLLEKNKDHFYIMHLSYGKDEDGKKKIELWDFSTKKNLIGLDLTNYVEDDWVKVRTFAAKNLKNDLLGIWTRQFDMFCEDTTDFSMKTGDIVLVLDGWSSLLGIAEVTTKHSYRPELASTRGGAFFDHVREVKWIKKYSFKERLKIPSVKGFNNTLAIVERGSKRWSRLVTIDVDC